MSFAGKQIYPCTKSVANNPQQHCDSLRTETHGRMLSGTSKTHTFCDLVEWKLIQ